MSPPTSRDGPTNIARPRWPGFTKRYGVTRLVWYEPFELIGAAVQREHTNKGYPRAWKLNLIEAENPERLDLYERFNL